MMIQSLLDLQERLESFPTPSTPHENLSAEKIGPLLYRRLAYDYSMDAGLFTECAQRLTWALEPVGVESDPMFSLLRTEKGTLVLVTIDQTTRPGLREQMQAYTQKQSVTLRIVRFFKRLTGKDSK